MLLKRSLHFGNRIPPLWGGQEGLRCYPNPFNKTITIRHSLRNEMETRNLTIRIYNVLGAEVYSKEIPNISSAALHKFWNDGLTINLKDLEKGIYILEVEFLPFGEMSAGQRGVVRTKIIKQ